MNELIRFHDQACVVAEIGPVCVVIWRGAATRERFDHQRAAIESVVCQFPGKAGFMLILEPSAPPPNAELRGEATKMLEDYKGRLAGAAGVVEGSGIAVSLTRSVLSGIGKMVGSRAVPLKFFAQPRSGAEWLAESASFDSAELSAAVERARAKIG